MKSITIVKSTVFNGGIIGLVRRVTLRSGLSELLLDGLSLCKAEYCGERDS